MGLWIEGDGDKIELGQGKVEARSAFINTGDPANDNVTLTNFNLRTSNDNSVVFANSATTTFGEVHGGADGAGYADSTETALTITGTMLPDTTVRDW